MKRFRVTTVQIIELPDSVENTGITSDQFKDSYNDSLLDAQDTEHETSDCKAYYIPRELEKVEIEEIDVLPTGN